jgi:hypothetical protein
MIETLEDTGSGTLGFKLSGKLHDEDYKHFVPAVEAAVKQHGKVPLLAQFQDFHGWDLKGLWDDIKFATEYCNKVERIAMMGETRWEEWMTRVCKPFTLANVNCFDRHELDAAWSWSQSWSFCPLPGAGRSSANLKPDWLRAL